MQVDDVLGGNRNILLWPVSVLWGRKPRLAYNPAIPNVGQQSYIWYFKGPAPKWDQSGLISEAWQLLLQSHLAVRVSGFS